MNKIAPSSQENRQHQFTFKWQNYLAAEVIMMGEKEDNQAILL